MAKRIVNDFSRGKIDLLVGTQSISKGFHFPNLTLVGIIWADVEFNFPSYNSAETAIHRLIQVAGRAGREEKTGKVLIQFTELSELMKIAREDRYEDFYSYEIKQREILNYPPFCVLIQIEFKNRNPVILQREVNNFAKLLRDKIEDKLGTVVGPSRPVVYKVANYESMQIFIKTNSLWEVVGVMRRLKNSIKISSNFSVVYL